MFWFWGLCLHSTCIPVASVLHASMQSGALTAYELRRPPHRLSLVTTSRSQVVK